MKMELKSMGRRELQALCKKHGLRANTTNANMAQSLASILEEPDHAVMIPAKEIPQRGVQGQVVNMAVDDDRFFSNNFKAISELPEHFDDISVSGTKGSSKAALAKQSCENNTDPYAFLVDWNSMLIEEKAQSAKCLVTNDQIPASFIATSETTESTIATGLIFDKELLEESKTGRTPDDSSPTSKPATSRDSPDSKEEVADNNDCSPIVRGSGLSPRTANTSLLHDEMFRRDSELGDGDSDDTECVVTSNVKVKFEHEGTEEYKVEYVTPFNPEEGHDMYSVAEVAENTSDTEEYKVEYVTPFIPEEGLDMYSVAEVAASTLRILDYQGSAPRQESTVPHGNSSGTLEIESAAYEDKNLDLGCLGMKEKSITEQTMVVASDFSTGGDVQISNILMERFDRAWESDLETTEKETKNTEEIEELEEISPVLQELDENISEAIVAKGIKVAQIPPTAASVELDFEKCVGCCRRGDGAQDDFDLKKFCCKGAASTEAEASCTTREVIDNSPGFTISPMKKGCQEVLSNKNSPVAASTVSMTSNTSLVRWPLELIQCTDVVIVLFLFLFFAYATLVY